MAWIESNQEVGRHPKTKKLARILDVSVVTAVGHLHYLWWWALDFAQDGALSKFDEYDIADACMWEGDAKLLVDALIQVGFIDENESILSIHDWYEYAGRLIERRQSDAERKREEREKRKNPSIKVSKKKTSNGRPTDVQEKSTDVLRNRTLPYPTVPNQFINNNNNAREEGKPDAKTEPADLAVDLSILPDEPKATGIQAVNWAEKNWGRMLSPGETQDITAWCDEFSIRGSPDPDAVVTEALKQCDLAGVRNIKYLRAVLTDWRETGVLTVAHVEAREAERKSQKEHKRNKDPVDKPTGPPTPSKYDNFYL